MGLNSLRPSSTKKESSKSNKRKLEKKLSFYASEVTLLLEGSLHYHSPLEMPLRVD